MRPRRIIRSRPFQVHGCDPGTHLPPHWRRAYRRTCSARVTPMSRKRKTGIAVSHCPQRALAVGMILHSHDPVVAAPEDVMELRRMLRRRIGVHVDHDRLAVVEHELGIDPHPGVELLAQRALDRLAAPEGGLLLAGPDPDCFVIEGDRKSTRLNSSHEWISYAVFCLKKK